MILRSEKYILAKFDLAYGRSLYLTPVDFVD